MDDLEASRFINSINGRYIGLKITPDVYKSYSSDLRGEINALKHQIGRLPEAVKIFAGDIVSAEAVALRHLYGTIGLFYAGKDEC